MTSFFIKIIEILFGLSLFLNAMLFIPQALRIYKNKSAQSISLVTFIGFMFMQVISILYGIVKNDWILTIGFGVSLITCSSIVLLALIYKNRN